jgi:hypothetical protein
MTNDSDVDTVRTTAKTHLPAYQKSIWQDHAEELSMSQSEFIKTMVQAGRRGFGADGPSESERKEGGVDEVEHSSSGDATPGGSGLEAWLFDVLAKQPCSWDELLDRRTADVEERLDEALERLQEQNRIQYSGRRGGYVLTETDRDER